MLKVQLEARSRESSHSSSVEGKGSPQQSPELGAEEGGLAAGAARGALTSQPSSFPKELLLSSHLAFQARTERPWGEKPSTVGGLGLPGSDCLHACDAAAVCW